MEILKAKLVCDPTRIVRKGREGNRYYTFKCLCGFQSNPDKHPWNEVGDHFDVESGEAGDIWSKAQFCD